MSDIEIIQEEVETLQRPKKEKKSVLESVDVNFGFDLLEL